MDLILAFVIAMVVTMALIPPLASVAGRLQVLDDPDARKVHTHPIPRVGGIAMAVGALAPLCVWLPMDASLRGYLLSVLVLVAFGAWDDRVALRARSKLAGQVIAVLLVMFVGHVSINTLMIAEPVSVPEWVGLPLTFLFLLGITNAINLADGLDGLAGGTALLCCAALALLAGSWKAPFVETLAVLLMGSLLGFLRFNTYPARIFMGDAGSQFLGFTVGVLCVLLSRDAATPVSTSLPLLLVGLPLVDTLLVMLRRLHAGRSPFSADKLHFHHRLLAFGFDHHEAVIVIYSLQCALLLLAWQLRFESDALILTVFTGFAATFAGTLLVLERSGWRWRNPTNTRRSQIARLRSWLAARQRLPRWSVRIAGTCICAYLLGIAVLSDRASTDIGWLATAGALALVFALFARAFPTAESWICRGVLFVAVIIAVYLDQTTVARSRELHYLAWSLLPLLAISAAVAMRLAPNRRFEATPLDVLLIFATLALPNLPGISSWAGSIGVGAAKLVLLCYTVELIAAVRSPIRALLLGAGAGFFAIIATRAFF